MLVMQISQGKRRYLVQEQSGLDGIAYTRRWKTEEGFWVQQIERLSFPVRYNYRIDTDHKDLQPVSQSQAILSSMFGVCGSESIRERNTKYVCKLCQRLWTDRRNKGHRPGVTTRTYSSDDIGYVGIAKPS